MSETGVGPMVFTLSGAFSRSQPSSSDLLLYVAHELVMALVMIGTVSPRLCVRLEWSLNTYDSTELTSCSWRGGWGATART
jgi:hypothetical protein